MLKLITPSASSGSTDPDEDLVLRMAQGEERALAELMDRRLSIIQALCTHMLGDVFMAEDISQNVFLKTWQIAPEWKPGKAKLMTWMRRVATHQCLDVLRKKAPIYTDSVPDIEDERENAVTAIENQDKRTIIDAAMTTIPRQQKAALTLSYYQNVSQKEGADILEMSVKAYESLLSRARKSLRAALNEHQSQPGGIDLL